MGISGSRFFGTAWVSETASRNLWPSSVKRRICGTMPAVEMVMLRPSMQPPDGWQRMRAALITLS